MKPRPPQHAWLCRQMKPRPPLLHHKRPFQPIYPRHGWSRFHRISHSPRQGWSRFHQATHSPWQGWSRFHADRFNRHPRSPGCANPRAQPTSVHMATEHANTQQPRSTRGSVSQTRDHVDEANRRLIREIPERAAPGERSHLPHQTRHNFPLTTQQAAKDRHILRSTMRSKPGNARQWRARKRTRPSRRESIPRPANAHARGRPCKQHEPSVSRQSDRRVRRRGLGPQAARVQEVA